MEFKATESLCGCAVIRLRGILMLRGFARSHVEVGTGIDLFLAVFGISFNGMDKESQVFLRHRTGDVKPTRTSQAKLTASVTPPVDATLSKGMAIDLPGQLRTGAARIAHAAKRRGYRLNRGRLTGQWTTPCTAAGRRFLGPASATLAVLWLSTAVPAFAGSTAASCPDPPEPVVTVGATQFYTDPKGSVPDPALMARFAKEEAPLRGYLRRVADLTDTAVMPGPQAGSAAACALNWLAHWADADALRVVLPNGSVQRSLAVASLSFSALKLFSVRPVCDVRRERIVAWLRRVLDGVMANEQVNRPPGRENNVTDWAALAAVELGILTGDPMLGDWGMGVFRRAFTALTPDGLLSAELKRGQRALTYELFASAPLMMIRVLAEKQHAVGFAAADLQVVRLFTAIRHALDEPDWFDAIAGTRQERIDLASDYTADLALALFACRFAMPWRVGDAPPLPGRSDYFLGSALPFLACPEVLPFDLPLSCRNG